MELELQIKGLDKLLADFAETPRVVQRVYDGRINQPLNEARRRLTRYPPPPAGSRYVRTGTLRAGWAGQAQRRGPLSRALSNPVEYAPFVQGRATQAGVHQGRWETAEGVAEGLDLDGLADQMANDIARQLRGG